MSGGIPAPRIDPNRLGGAECSVPGSGPGGFLSPHFVPCYTGVHMRRFLAIFVAVLLSGSLAISAAERRNAPTKEKRLPPERILPLTKEQLLKKVPQFYAFSYEPDDPQPGKRYWLRVNNSTWIER